MTNGPSEMLRYRGLVCDTIKALLDVIDKALDKDDVWYSVGYGSLLAIVRDGDCILDTDADLVILLKDIDRVAALLEKQAKIASAALASSNVTIRVLRYGGKHAEIPVDTDGRQTRDPWYQGTYSGPNDEYHLPLRLHMARADGSLCAQPHIDFVVHRKGIEPRRRCMLGGQQTYCLTNHRAHLDPLYGSDWDSVVKPRPADVKTFQNSAISKFFDSCHLPATPTIS